MDLESKTESVQISDAELGEKIVKIWQDFAAEQPSPSLSVFMKDAKLTYANQKLDIMVTSQLAKASIVEQRTLFESIREAAEPILIDIEFEIDPEAQPAIVQQSPMLTNQDKYNALLKQNPILEKLITKLDLKIDNE